MHQNRRDPIPDGLRYCGRLRRLASMTYEGVLLFGVVFVADYLFDTLTQSHDGLALRHWRQVLVFVAIGTYFVASWRRKGQTLPMKTWHIRLMMRDGRGPGSLRLVMRYLLAWTLPLIYFRIVEQAVLHSGNHGLYWLLAGLPLIFFLWTWFDPERQFLHDRLLGTRLVDQRSLPS